MRSFLLVCLSCLVLWYSVPDSCAEPGVPILLYHRFGPVVADSMTLTTPVFESHLKYLKDNGYKVIPLRELLDMYSGRGVPSDSRCVVLVADDAHISYRVRLCAPLTPTVLSCRRVSSITILIWMGRFFGIRSAPASRSMA